MKYILFGLGTMGDNLPFIRIGAELVSRGHSVLFLGNERFADIAFENGLDFEAVSTEEEYIRAYNNPLTWSHYHSREHYREYHFPAIRKTFVAIKKQVEAGPKPLVVFQDGFSGAKLACDFFNLKYCQILLAPSGLDSGVSPSFPLRDQIKKEDWQRALAVVREKSRKSTFDKLFIPFINPLCEELGLPQFTTETIPQRENSENLLALFPQWLKKVPSDWPKHLVFSDFPLESSPSKELNHNLDAFINEKGAPIVYSFGTGVPLNRPFLEKIKTVSDILGMPAVLVGKTLQNSELYELGENILSVPYSNFDALFPRARVIVHHGGIGTCSEALSAGVPQLISAFAFDQPDNAYLLWKLGVANAVNILGHGARKLADTITYYIEDDSIKQQCLKYKNLTSRNGVKTAADYLERIVEESTVSC